MLDLEEKVELGQEGITEKRYTTVQGLDTNGWEWRVQELC